VEARIKVKTNCRFNEIKHILQHSCWR